MKHNHRSDAAGFPNDGNPPKRPLSAPGFPDDIERAPNNLVRMAIDDAISSLGDSIHKTILWHMNNRGVFADPNKMDIMFHYDNLRELVGPGADILMEKTWEYIVK